MDDLMKCLYEFVSQRRMGSVCEDPEYEEVTRGVEMQIKRVEKDLDQDQQRELRLLLENISAQSSLESEHLFHAALRLSRELNALVRA